MSYDKGDIARLTGTFSDINGTAVDPLTVTLMVRSPAGTLTTRTYAGGDVTKSATGSYYADVALTESGSWFYRWESTGTAQAAAEGFLPVEPSNF